MLDIEDGPPRIEGSSVPCPGSGDESVFDPFFGVFGFGLGPGRNRLPTGGKACRFLGVSGELNTP